MICVSFEVLNVIGNAIEPITLLVNTLPPESLKIFGLESPYWGTEQVVTGLLTGKDIIDGLQNKDLGDEVLLPSIMLKNGESTLLDDITVQEIRNALKVPITIIYGPEDFVKHVIRERKDEV